MNEESLHPGIEESPYKEITCLHCGKKAPINEEIFKHLPGCDGNVWDLIPVEPLQTQNKKSRKKED